MKVQVEMLTDIPAPEVLEIGDFVDLRCAENVNMKKGDFMLIPLGVKMKLPENMTAILVPRSSTFKRYGILQANSIGIIDHTYGGEWMLAAYATRDTYIDKGERICQFALRDFKTREMLIEVVDEIEREVDRGGGFGSTGRS